MSGALDRLHYEKDPCVKYNSEKKLWIYLHRDRTLDFPRKNPAFSFLIILLVWNMKDEKRKSTFYPNKKLKI